jgi:hypothetical protein
MNLNISNAVTTGAPPDLEATTLEVFKKKGITKEQYDTSFIFYTRNPQLLSEIYQLVLNNLSQLQAEVANQKDTSEPKKDSLQKP